MAKFSLIIYKEISPGKTREPFIATCDPEIVSLVRNFIAARLKNKPSQTEQPKIAQEYK